MSRIAEQLYQVHVERAHGAQGIHRLQAVLAAAKRVYAVRSPQSFPEGLVVLASLSGSAVLERESSTRIDTFKISELPINVGSIVEVAADGLLRARALSPQDDLGELAKSAVVYAYSVGSGPDSESIILPGRAVSIPNPNGYPSALAAPTFWELEDSLEWYHERLARRSTCKILKTAWADDGANRHLVFTNSPESIMRESLAQHLRSSLRDHQAVRVNEEQNQSETEPVDIEVTWSLTTHIALIEIKWLGKCLDATLTKLASYSYSEGRARDGVPQLIRYLDDASERNPGHEIKGYLVVFDGRRRNVTKWQPTAVSNSDAWHYSDREIDFLGTLPARRDFQPPRRFFLNPRVPPPITSN